MLQNKTPKESKEEKTAKIQKQKKKKIYQPPSKRQLKSVIVILSPLSDRKEEISFSYIQAHSGEEPELLKHSLIIQGIKCSLLGSLPGSDSNVPLPR
ncbi:hypothetical protein AVEN_224363-1 [Araneus ventricosus]|uniref:Uncharacterized protein n=1 Tax=Araneus ventricosus TaxID=182803 RepID=A0A4Y2QAA9_ARAVE|nr:hypothetical protein AVEN_224363-1 [Araneus ventricosus]